jgi:hypothetical protein
MLFHNLSSGSPTNGEPCRNYYQILEISPNERDPQVIEEAALRCSSRVRVYQLARELECAKELNEIAQALNTLLDPAQRREYDLRLGKTTSPEEAKAQPSGIINQPVLLREAFPALPPAELPHLFRNGAGQSCDVKLVYRRQAV